MTTTTPIASSERPAGTGHAARHAEAQGRASLRERHAFEAALARHLHAAPGPAGPEPMATTAVESEVAGHRATTHPAPDGGAGTGAGAGAAAPPAQRSDSPERGSSEPTGCQSRPAGTPSDLALAALRRRSPQDEPQAPLCAWPEPAAPLHAALPLPELAAVLNPLAATPRPAAAEVPLATAARQATLAEMAASPAGSPQRWQVQLTEPALPVRSLSIERSSAGPLTLIVSTNQPVPAHQADRLRRQLAARGADPLMRSAPDLLDEDFPQ